MTDEIIDYAKLVDRAMRNVLRDALEIARDQGLPSDHNFYITFETRKAGVDISPVLGVQYPEEMTIVLEHQFWDLDVTDESFAVTLSFGGKRERLFVPYDAVTAFVDPSVKFGLQFGQEEGAGLAQLTTEDDEAETIETTADTDDENSATVLASDDGTVVALDSFRKK
ncbi:MAG: hypothetical protein GKS01_03805 [Alphaproteobacteria bacterium]|nr:hypothetical protein [Alphaproteobacteria bacterium]